MICKINQHSSTKLHHFFPNFFVIGSGQLKFTHYYLLFYKINNSLGNYLTNFTTNCTI